MGKEPFSLEQIDDRTDYGYLRVYGVYGNKDDVQYFFRTVVFERSYLLN